MLAQRPSKGLLGGMWEFPNGKVRGDPVRGLPITLRRLYHLEVQSGDPLGIVEHGYSHFSVSVHAFRCEAVLVPKAHSLRWILLSDLDDFPMGRIDRQIARKLA